MKTELIIIVLPTYQLSSFLTLYLDTEGRKIRYTLRPSNNTSRATILELLVEGKKPRKVKHIMYDDSLHVITDGRNRLTIPPNDIATVMKCLNFLCKVGSIQLDCINASPTLRKVLSNLDLSR